MMSIFEPEQLPDSFHHSRPSSVPACGAGSDGVASQLLLESCVDESATTRGLTRRRLRLGFCQGFSMGVPMVVMWPQGPVMAATRVGRCAVVPMSVSW